MTLLPVRLLVDRYVVIETLSRIGIANRKTKVLYPSCYLYDRDDETYLVHFKQLFTLLHSDGYNNMSVEDEQRVGAVAFNLKNWGLVACDVDIVPPLPKVFVLAHKEKPQWHIVHKFNIHQLKQHRTVDNERTTK